MSLILRPVAQNATMMRLRNPTDPVQSPAVIPVLSVTSQPIPTDSVPSPITKREDSQETAVAAGSKNNSSRGKAPIGMSICNEQDLSGLREGLRRRHAVNSNPPAGLVHWPLAAELPDNVNVCNAIVTHVLVGESCDVTAFAGWCNTTPLHITVITLTSAAQRMHSHMKEFLKQATKYSLLMMFFNTSGQRRKTKVL